MGEKLWAFQQAPLHFAWAAPPGLWALCSSQTHSHPQTGLVQKLSPPPPKKAKLKGFRNAEGQKCCTAPMYFRDWLQALEQCSAVAMARFCTRGSALPTATRSSCCRPPVPHTTPNNQKRVKMFLACELSQVQPSVTCSLKLSTTATAPSNIFYCYRREPCARRLTPSLHKATVLRCTATIPSPGTACEAVHCAGKSNSRFPTVPAQLLWVLSSHH